jgi:hypothetical protein
VDPFIAVVHDNDTDEPSAGLAALIARLRY